MNILVVIGSAKKNCNTELMAEAFAVGPRGTRNSVTIKNLSRFRACSRLRG